MRASQLPWAILPPAVTSPPDDDNDDELDGAAAAADSSSLCFREASKNSRRLSAFLRCRSSSDSICSVSVFAIQELRLLVLLSALREVVS
jgi:hypothetical protein